MKKKTDLLQILAEGDYAKLVWLINSSWIHRITDEEACAFYQNAPEDWVVTLLERHQLSPKVERVVITYNSAEVVATLYRTSGFFHETIEWAFEQSDEDITEKVLNCLEYPYHRPSPKAEVAFVKRGNSELFKLYLEKFGDLCEEAEKLLNEDSRLSSLLSIYVNRELLK